MAQELVTKIARKDRDENLDFGCPDCHSALIIIYDEQDQRRYLCENCEQEPSPREIDREDDDNDENIYIVTIGKSNRRFF